MTVQYINIDEYKYRVEYIPYEECGDERFSSYYVMLRNFNIINNIVTDNNIYFIESNIYEQYKEILRNKDEENNLIVFPSNMDVMHYSSTYGIFNDTYIDSDIINDLAKYDIYYKKQLDENDQSQVTFLPAKIKCDLVKIYHPFNKINQNFIIHIENVINNIHFHYLCKTNSFFHNNNLYDSNTEIRFENNIYSEYIKCYIPNIKELFDRKIIDKDTYDYDLYFKEDMNIVDEISLKNANFIENTIIKVNNNNNKAMEEQDIDSQFVPLALFTQPWGIEEYDQDKNQDNIIQKEEKLFKKVYFKYHLSIDNNYITTPINISLFPYKNIDASTKIYLIDDNLPGTCSIKNDYKFKLIGLFDFNNDRDTYDDALYNNHYKSIPSLIGYFDYPGKEYYTENFNSNSLTEAYCFYHHIVNRNIYLNTNLNEEYKNELDEIRELNTIDSETIDYLIRTGNATNNLSKEEYLQILKNLRLESFLEEYADQYKASIDFFGFRIEVASDKHFTHLIYNENVSLFDAKRFNKSLIDNIISEDNDTKNINDLFSVLGNGEFFFDLRGLFTDWKQMPEMIVCRLTFIDRFIGNEIQSNDIYITKDKFKYIINNSGFSRVEKLTKLNDSYYNSNKDNINMKTINLNDTDNIDKLNSILDRIEDESIKTELTELFNNFNYKFINNINCIINKNDVSTIQGSNNSNNTQIIYKPIFFRTNSTNNISIKYKQNQNIGIDLHEYISKVDMFIMTIDNNMYKEIGRNANYVIFNISANLLTDDNGTYEIYNSDHEYITYGSWSIIR